MKIFAGFKNIIYQGVLTLLAVLLLIQQFQIQLYEGRHSLKNIKGRL